MSTSHWGAPSPHPVTTGVPIMSWYERMRSQQSRGQTTAKPARLGGLAEARRQTLGQYFTPDAIAALMFAIAKQAVDHLVNPDSRKVSILDNSIGSGRLIQFADPSIHSIFGIDVDTPLLETLGEALQEGGFTFQLSHVGMENVVPREFDVCLANPPFSLTLSSPNMTAYPCTSHGKFGPNTSSLSQDYALHQALSAAQVVIVLLPSTTAVQVEADPHLSCRLRASIQLPANAFRSENASVSTRILVFGPNKRPTTPVSVLWEPGDPIPTIPDMRATSLADRKARLQVHAHDQGTPVITRPVTSDVTVRLTRKRRMLKVQFRCGLAEAKGLNAIMRSHVPHPPHPAEHRYPTGVRYTGQGALYLDHHLCSADPVQSIERTVIGALQSEGLHVEVDPGLMPFVRKAKRRLIRQLTPFARFAWINSNSLGQLPLTEHFEVVSPKKQLLAPLIWGSPIVPESATLPVKAVDTPKGRGYSVSWNGASATLTGEELLKRFALPEVRQSGWIQVEEGRLGKFPSFESFLRKRMERLGIRDWLWDFQADDVIEVMLGTTGALLGHEMGLGKSRLALALALMSVGRHALIVTEAHLVFEMLAEIRKIGLSKDSWQVIESERELQTLRKINLISYSRLRLPVSNTKPKLTFAHALRRQIHTIVADEVHVAAHPESQQSRALAIVGARCRFGMTGTPIPNYPRDLLPVATCVVGANNPLQPYGHGPLCSERNAVSMDFVPRGVDAFRERFVTLDWVTNEFAESMQTGAKRELPRIRDVPGYREWIRCILKRRVRQEPQVAKHVRIPAFQTVIHEVVFDDAHLSHYLAVADDFAEWYRAEKARCQRDGKVLNLMLLIRRIQELTFALNFPQQRRDTPSCYRGGLTSKQRWVIQHCNALRDQGERFIVFGHSPGLLDLLEQELAKQGTVAPALHGKLPPRRRMDRLDSMFRNGSAHGILLSYQANKNGLNIAQANRVVLYDRDWTAKTEDQAIARVLRPDQSKQVTVDCIHVQGSLDLYMDQTVSAKRQAAHAGLDWGESQSGSFVHMDELVERYVRDLATRRGLDPHQARRLMKYVA
ncbi:helicase-related protein [Ahniella affigens]|nr:helicase-related protein [Ahniella affigens]